MTVPPLRLPRDQRVPRDVVEQTCSACGAPIWWAVTERNHKPIPIDVLQHDDGNLALTGDWARGRYGSTRVVAVYKRTLLDDPETLLWRTHFQTCPKADQLRKKKS